MRIDERDIDELDAIVDKLIREASRLGGGDIREGLVMTPGPPPYRRLDCGPRALAYIRSRPRKGAVRVDVSGLWVTPANCRLRVKGRGMAVLFLRSPDDVADAVAFLLDTMRMKRNQACGSSPVRNAR